MTKDGTVTDSLPWFVLRFPDPTPKSPVTEPSIREGWEGQVATKTQRSVTT